MFKCLVPFLALLTGIAAAGDSQLIGAGALGISGANWEQGGIGGVEIIQVSRDSSAGLAGLHVGDVITDVNGKHVGSIQELSDLLAQLDAGTKVSVGYIIKTQLGWMPKDAVVILAKKDYDPNPADTNPAAEPTKHTGVPVQLTNAAPDPPVLTIRTQKPLTNQDVVDLPNEIGIYMRQNGKLIDIEPEVVNWRTGGVIKTMATVGLDKGHVNGTIPGPHSGLIISWARLGLAGPLEFYIRCPEGNSASEYQLLRLWDKGNRREFRSVTGGILHRLGGAQLNEVAFKFEKIAPRTYKIQLNDLKAGEYGFLAPGAIASSNAASLGRIYTFRIPE